MSIHSVCVFCGSSPGANPAYRRAAQALGAAIARRGLTLAYGAGNVGLMAEVADAALTAGGEVIGVIPRHLLDLELAHQGLTRLEVVDTMHERKARLAELSDAFVAMPGGLGTLDELCEIATWAQLALHAKPIALLDVSAYWQPFLAFVDHAVAERFVRAEHREMLLVEGDPDALLDRLASQTSPALCKWLDRA
ncbi:MAG: TIGR00730 family Rossman fold protein [Holophagales bacterium]|nr:MAG: TIGR00730 family Rossman fold protein [Holophagales bacterium]